MITVRSTINLAHQSVPNIIPVVQGDTGRAILFTLADFTIPEGATARYFVMKPSGLSVYNDATIDGNTVLVELTAQSIIETGDNYGQVRISVGDDIVTSFDFILHVEQFRGIDAAESTTEMNIFDALVTSAVDEAREQIEDIAEEVIETIPDDYTALTENVADLNETIYDLAEAQGNPVIIYDGADNVPVKDLKITFSASSNVNRIQVVRSGKNLVVDKLANGAVDGDGKYTNNSKRITNSFTSTYPISRTWLKAGTYTLSVPGLSACTVVIKTDSTTVAHAWALEQALPFTFTTQTDGYFIFSARNSSNTDISPSDYHAQLEAGSKATDFEPARVKTVTTILYPLSISEGVLDFTTGQLTSGGSVYAVDAADISTVEGYNRIDAYMMSNSTAHMASTTTMDVIYRKNGYAWDKFLNVYPTEQAQGNPATFTDGAEGVPVKDLKVEIVPQQDLHGYDHPWPAGGGVNKANLDGAVAYSDGTYGMYVTVDGEEITLAGTWTKSDTTGSWRFLTVPNITNGLSLKVFEQTSGNHVNQNEVYWDGTNNRLAITCRSMTPGTAYTIKIKIVAYEGSTAPDTWTPYSNLCPITGTDSVEVKRTGKNLFAFGNQSPTTHVDLEFSEPLPAGTYTISAKVTTTSTGNQVDARFRKQDGSALEKVTIDANTGARESGTFTISEPAYYVYLYASTGNVQYVCTWEDIQLEESPTATSYEPYKGQTLDIPLPQTVYGGTLDVTTGEMVLTNGYVSDLSQMTWTKWNTTSGNWRFMTNFAGKPTPKVPASTVTIADIISSSYKSVTAANTWNGMNGIALDTNGELLLCDLNVSDTTALDAALANVQLVYKLATPVTVQLTPQELTTILGVNHISTDAESVDVEYRADIKLYIENLTKPEEDDLIANQAIEAGKFFMIGNRLFLSTASIANGATINPGTNATELSLAEALNSLN